MAEQRAHAVTSSYWPTLDAVTNLGYWSDTTTTSTTGTWRGPLAVYFSGHCTTGACGYGLARERHAFVNAAREDVRAARRDANFDVVSALRTVQKSQAALGVAARNRELAGEMARLARLAYAAGTGTSFDLVDTARRQREAELDYTIKEFAIASARLNATFALANCRA